MNSDSQAYDTGPEPGIEDEANLPANSPFSNLNAIVLAIEWEISDETMAQLVAEIERLKKRFQDHKILRSFLQLQGSVGRYIEAKKVDAHPDSIKLLHTVHGALLKVVTSGQMTEKQQQALLNAEIDKFKRLKSVLAKVGGEPDRHVPRQRAAAQTVDAPEREDAADPLPEAVRAAITELKQFIREEFDRLREEIKSHGADR